MKTDSSGRPILSQYSEEGFIDCVLKIINLQETEHEYLLQLTGSHNGGPVGMTVTVIKGIKAGFDSDMNLIKHHVYSQGVRFIRSGEESDRLITSLSELYGFSTGNLKMVDGESFTAIALHQGEIDMEQQPIKIKLFGRDSDKNAEDEYYESFFNVDLKNRLVFWNEKDQEYRKPLIKGLSK